MARIVSREQPHAAVSVAELLRRCAPAPTLDQDTAAPIPVSALLNREGRAAEGLPRVPDQPQTSAAETGSAAPAGRKQLVRRSAMAAGALLAAGSAFALTTAAMHGAGEQPQASGTYPGEGALDGVAADTPSSVPDSGTPAPTSWMPVAFPTSLGGSTVAKLARAAETATHAAAPAAAAAGPAAGAGPAHVSSSGTSTHQTTSAGATSTNHSNGVAGGAVADTTKSLGDTVSSVGQSTPLAGVTKPVGHTVDTVGTTVGHTVDNPATPVVSGAVPAAPPSVSGATSTVTGAATSATGAVTKTATKTVSGLLG